MSYLEIVRKDGTVLGTIDEVNHHVEVGVDWANQPHKTVKQAKAKKAKAKKEEQIDER
jgi:hypothetical protein